MILIIYKNENIYDVLQKRISEIYLPDLYWLAGILEGEGCFMKRYKNTNSKHSIGIIIQMKDCDIIRKTSKILGGNIRKQKRGIYRTGIYGIKSIIWMKKLYPLMGTRRRNQIKKAFISIGLLITDDIEKIKKSTNKTYLSEETKKQIYLRYKNTNTNISQKKLAEIYNVSIGMINIIIRNYKKMFEKKYLCSKK